MDEVFQNVERINAIATRHIEGLRRIFERAEIPSHICKELERLEATHAEIHALIQRSPSQT